MFFSFQSLNHQSASTTILLDSIASTVEDASRLRDVLNRARRLSDSDSFAASLHSLRDLIDDQADRWASLAVDVDRCLTTLAASQPSGGIRRVTSQTGHLNSNKLPQRR